MAKKSGKKDFAQNALRVVEQATTSQLAAKPSKPPKSKRKPAKGETKA